MHLPSLSTTAITLLLAANAATTLVEAKIKVLSWDAAYGKAEALVSQMTLEQKVAITTGTGWMKGACVGNTYGTTSPDFPALCLQDAPLGIRFAYNVTSGVSGINAAASFDRKAIRERAEYMGKEFRGKGVHVQLGPAMNFMRNPRGGRGWEAGGEDPFLMGVLSEETVKGIQEQGVIATAKHYILNEQETNRKKSSSDVDSRTLHEIYLWPFARSVEAGVGSIMCSYNMANGTYACENEYLMNTVLKGELGFKGFVQSDWSATHSTVDAANNGLDMDMPGDVDMDHENTGAYFGKNLTDAVEAGKVPEERATDMAMRIVASWYKMNQDKDYPEISLDSFHLDKAPFVNVQSNHKKLVREMGAASNVLLKNVKDTLPIDPKKVKKIAVIGSDSITDPKLFNCADHGCTGDTLAQGWGSGTSFYPYLIDPLTGLTDAFGKKVAVKSTADDWNLEKAAEVAKDSDYAFVFSNADSGEEYINIDGNVGDRKNLTLWHNGDNLIKAVADANKNTIVVIHAVGSVLMPWIDHPNIKAVLWPGLPGQESGNSLADVVTGKVNPSGRLPYTIAKKEEDYNTGIDEELAFEYKEKLLMGYKWFDHAKIEPLFAFGHGLSYTKFDYSKLKVKAKASYDKKDKKTIKDATVKVSISIKNAGHVDGAEVVQAYLSFPESAGSPPQQLRGFEKVFLKKGKKENVDIELTKTELSIWDEATESWVIPSGKFTINIGASSRDIRKSSSFTL
ncbi:glycoside hydrolase superfamily, partial [Helicostylum pulchrum]|uniref:Probable beta-glucosidase G n=1 Tax=Helicostylum pulchrum TaxID=562976 RepID=A0ABP9Y122_9FUNG